MIYAVYAIRDALTGFMQPTFELNDACAKRNFEVAVTCVSPPGHLLSARPADFTLYKIGQYDSDSGGLVPLSPPECICTGSSLAVSRFRRGIDTPPRPDDTDLIDREDYYV